MASPIEITKEDVKSYLVITSTDFDSNLTAMLGVWNNVVDFMIEDTYLNDSNYEDTLKAGKLLFICSKLGDVLPKDIVGRASERVEFTLGDAKTVTDNRSSGKVMTSDAIQLLRPYLKDESLLTSSTEDVIAEFSFTDNGW
jgi:hypothetical protein